MFTLDTEQEEAVQRMASEPTGAALNASETGTGKTIMAVELSRRIDAQTILVVGPANPGVRSSWEQTFAIQRPELEFRNLTASTRKSFDINQPLPGVWYVSKEFMRMHDSLTNKTAGREKPETDIPWHRAEFDMVIADEAHFATNRNAKTTRVLHRLRKCKYRLALSATPQGSNFTGFWALCRFLWYDVNLPGTDKDTPIHKRYIIDSSYHRWAAKWCDFETVYTAKRDPVTGQALKIENAIGPKGNNPRAFTDSLPCYVSLKAERQTTHTRRVYIDLTPEQRRIHDELVEEAVAWLNEHEVLSVDYPITMKQRLRQVTLATPVLEEGLVSFDPEGPSAKADKIRRVRAEHPNERIVVYTTSEKFTKVLASREPNAVLWTGPVSKKKRMENLRYFLDTPGAMLIATYGAIAEGMDGLQHVCSIEVWADEPYSVVQATQVEGRLNRRGQKNEIIRYRMLANDTADTDDLERLIQRTTDRKNEL